jgi:hypothetical protein
MPDVGRKPPDENHTQSVLFFKDADWTKASSKKWCKDHDYYTDGLDETDKLFRWRQYDPDDDKYRYRQKVIEKKNGESSIALVLAFKKGNQMITKLDTLVSSFVTSLRGLFLKEQAVSMSNVYQLVYAELDKQKQTDNIYRALVDVYLDGASMFAVFAMNGLLYKADIMLASGGVVMGDPVQVEIQYAPVAQSLKTLRQADGKYRWFAFPAATAVLNRSGELDSRQLFESFVKRIEDGAPYPYLTFYHVGEAIKLGLADYVAVDGYTLLMSGLWDAGALPQAVRQAIENDPDYYGISIGYFYQPETKERLQVGEGITIPVYTDGILVEASILAEQDASCLFTGAYTEGVNRMNKKAKDELEKIVAGNPELEAQVAELEKHVDEVNASTEGLIRREKETPEPPPALEVVPAPAIEPEPITSPAELILDQEGMEALTERVAEKVNQIHADEMKAWRTANEEVVQSLQASVTKLTARVAELEKPLEETVKQALQDMPRNQVKVVYRPTLRQAEQPETQVSSEDVAQETLANLQAGKEK